MKRREHAQAGIPEYWIVDPRDERITVLRLDGKKYAVHGEYTKGTTAVSHLLPGFLAVDVTTAFAQRLPTRPEARRQPRVMERGMTMTTATPMERYTLPASPTASPGTSATSTPARTTRASNRTCRRP